MKKIISVTALAVLLLSGAVSAQAQRPELPWHVAARVGVIGNVYENVGSYLEHKKAYDLITGSLSVSAGYDFTHAFSVRATASSDKNAGACNSRQSGGGFYPYVFSSLNFFTDAMLNVSKKTNASFIPKFYVGLGFAHTSSFEKEHSWSHDWENIHGDLPFVVQSNTVFGFRGGFLAEFLITNEVGIVLDACGEFYTDLYDGLQPTQADQEAYTGYAGFPFDMRGILSVGLAYHF